jgi:hypothetical protein
MELRGFQRSRADGSAPESSPLATAQIVFTTGASVQRHDWCRDRAYVEELVVEEGAIRLDRLRRGAPLLNTHSQWSLEAQLGVVENPLIQNGQGTCSATFSRRESVAGYVQDVADGIIRNVSVGYVRHRIEMVAPANEGELWRYRVVDWEPYEVSLVPIPADMDSQIRSVAGTACAPGADGAASAEQAYQLRTFPCEFIETRAQSLPTVGLSAETPTRKDSSMPQSTEAGGSTATAPTLASYSPAAHGAAPEAGTVAQRSQADAATQAAIAAASAASAASAAADITDLCARHGVAHLAGGLIRSGNSVEQARSAVLDELARRDAASGGHRNTQGGQIQTLRDEMQTRMAGIEQAVLHRVAAQTQLDDNGRQYRGMSLLELGRDFLEGHGVSTRGMDRLTLATRMLHFRAGGMHTSSDFPSLFANVANKRLRSAYDENPGTYALWARRAPNAPDFKNITITALSAAPDLLRTNEHGEFKYGSMKDGAESYQVLTYGRIVSLSRQAIINDDLRAFDRLVSAFGFAARRLENRLVYAQLTANAALSDGTTLFHAHHGNLGTGAGSALQFTALSAGRTAMRLQKGLAGEELGIAPSYLIVPASLEQTAYQLTSSHYVPARQADVNEFRSGGRTSLEPIVEPLLDGASTTAWYLAASNAQVDTVEYCYLDGAEGPVIESDVGFETDGISYKCREDFATKAIEHRGLYRAEGV